jgi:hypothetical protein
MLVLPGYAFPEVLAGWLRAGAQRMADTNTGRPDKRSCLAQLHALDQLDTMSRASGHGNYCVQVYLSLSAGWAPSQLVLPPHQRFSTSHIWFTGERPV